MRQAEQTLTADQTGEPRCLDLLDGRVRKESTGEHHAGKIGFEDQGAPEMAHDGHDIDQGPAKPAVLLGERQTQEAGLRQKSPVSAIEPVRLLEHRPTVLERIRVTQVALERILEHRDVAIAGQARRDVHVGLTAVTSAVSSRR